MRTVRPSMDIPGSKLEQLPAYQPDELLRMAFREGAMQEAGQYSLALPCARLEWSVEDGVAFLRGHVRTHVDRERFLR